MLNRDFKEFAESLNARGVEYLVVGGYALAAHGHPRYTGDIEWWCGFVTWMQRHIWQPVGRWIPL